MIRIVIQVGSRQCTIKLTEETTTETLYYQVGEVLKHQSNHIRLFYSCGMIPRSSTATLKDHGLYDNVKVFALIRLAGGGGPLYSPCADCLMKHLCPFHELFPWNNYISELNIKQYSYKILCYKFNFSDEDIRAIEDSNEDNYIRLGDVMHRIYHKDPKITKQKIIEIIRDANQ